MKLPDTKVLVVTVETINVSCKNRPGIQPDRLVLPLPGILTRKFISTDPELDRIEKPEPRIEGDTLNMA